MSVRQLQRRLARLETRTPDIFQITVKVTFVRPNGEFGGDSDSFRAKTGSQIWYRETGESLEEFENRVLASGRFDNELIKVAYFYPGEEDDPDGKQDFKPGQIVRTRDA